MSILDSLLQKINDPSLTPISGTDAAFLVTESPNSPMHVGTLTIVEGSLSFEDFKNSLMSKMHLVPKFRQRLVTVPLNLDSPYWVDDPNFDIDIHLKRVALPNPKDWRTLRELTSSIFSTPLDLRRPLWSIDYIEGLDGVSQLPKGSVAIVSKVHHVMVDGISGMGIMSVMYDSSAKVPAKKTTTSPVPYNPPPIPDDLSILLKSSLSFFNNPLKLPRLVAEMLYKNVSNMAIQQIMPSENLPSSSYSVPRTIFNENISPKRKWGTAILEFERVKNLKDVMGVKLNDVLLAICSGAIRKYLVEKNKLPAQSIVANVPISVRGKEDDGKIDNRISNMIIPIATDVADPIECLEAINEYTVAGKAKHKALGAKTLSKMADAVPFGLANLAAGIYSRYDLKKLHKPVFNVTITNVPGPQKPLHLQGHKVETIMGMGPLIDGLGLIIAILSYNGYITISPTSDAHTMPDIDVFCRYLRESANELETLVLAKAKKEAELKKPKSDAFFQDLKKYLAASPDNFKDYEGVFQFNVNGVNTTNWQVNLNKGLVKRGSYKDPDALITITDRHLNQIARAEIGLTEAKIQGRIKVEDFNNKFDHFVNLVTDMVTG
ncbi:MAG TPA: wax ester/triacylglycerol synthase family O-acyltransferase [Microscillaceae bacterium]|nr:wax ester/triacylglycerol synthase family O-acyltransferase [Microscillaceae bacterium]